MLELGIGLIIASFMLLIASAIMAIKSNLPERKSILNKRIKFYNKIDSHISKLKPTNKIKEKLQLKYGVINSSTESKNRIAAVKTIFYISIFSIISIVLVSYVIGIWYMVVLVSLGVIALPYLILFSILEIELNKLKRQFPEGINTFITKYTSDKNKDRALQSTYLELENPIRFEFKRLSRMMANKSNIYEAVSNFCKRTGYVWADIFGELLIMNHNEVEDIGDELNELGLLIAEEQSLEAHKKAALSGTKTVNLIVVAFTAAAIFFNVAVFKSEAINIYFQSYLGRVSVSVAFVTAVISVALTFYFEKN